MNIVEALRAYRGLSPMGRRLVRTKRLSGAYKPGLWLRVLKRTSRFDEHADKLRRMCAIVAAVGLVAILVSLGALMATAGVEQPLWVMVGLGVGGIALLVFGIPWLYLRWRDLPNVLREFVYPIVRLVAEDVKPGETASLQLDLTGFKRRNKKVGSRPVSGRSNYVKAVDTLYEDPWFQGSARLCDGSNLHWRIVDRVRVRKITKRGRSGKLKFQTKSKTKRRMEVTLGARKDVYRVTEPPAEPAVDVVATPTSERNRLRAVAVTQWSDQPGDDRIPSIDSFVGLVAAAYRRVERTTARARLT